MVAWRGQLPSLSNLQTQKLHTVAQLRTNTKSAKNHCFKIIRAQLMKRFLRSGIFLRPEDCWVHKRVYTRSEDRVWGNFVRSGVQALCSYWESIIQKHCPTKAVFFAFSLMTPTHGSCLCRQSHTLTTLIKMPERILKQSVLATNTGCYRECRRQSTYLVFQCTGPGIDTWQKLETISPGFFPLAFLD